MVAKTVPAFAAAQLAGAAPVRMVRIADAPVVLSTASSLALLTATLYWMAQAGATRATASAGYPSRVKR